MTSTKPLTFKLNDFHVTVSFGDGINPDSQGKALLQFEKHLRALTGLDIRVFKDRMADDSKLRRMMTSEERNKL